MGVEEVWAGLVWYLEVLAELLVELLVVVLVLGDLLDELDALLDEVLPDDLEDLGLLRRAEVMLKIRQYIAP